MLNLLCIVLANFSVLASPTCGPTDEPTVGWVQHGGDFSKCDNQGPDQLSRVANVLACEAMAVSRGDVYFNFNFQMLVNLSTIECAEKWMHWKTKYC